MLQSGAHSKRKRELKENLDIDMFG